MITGWPAATQSYIMMRTVPLHHVCMCTWYTAVRSYVVGSDSTFFTIILISHNICLISNFSADIFYFVRSSLPSLPPPRLFSRRWISGSSWEGNGDPSVPSARRP